jgi:hypothetical protein
MKEKQKLPYWIRERDLDFINDTQLDKIENIEKETSSNAKSFRRELYDHRTIISKSKRQFVALEKAKQDVKRLQKALADNKNSSSELWTDLSPFKTKYSFTTCITIQRIEKEVKIGGEFGEKKIRKYEYFNLGINRPNQRKPVNIFLGTEKKFIDFLLKVYPLDKDEILKDWKEYCNKITGMTRYNPQQVIQSMMIENPKGFSGKSIKKEDVFVP